MTTTVLRKRQRNPTKFDALEVFAAWAQQNRIPIVESDAVTRFAKFLAGSLKESLESPITLYGGRTQAMFEAVVANLGHVQLVKREDAGDVHSQDEGLEIPDTRIVLADGRHLLVETKNFHFPYNKAFVVKRTYLDGLARYATLMGCELRFAIFWSQLQQWTFVAPTAFVSDGDRVKIRFQQAYKVNDMATLGDKLVGLPFPVTVRGYAEKLENAKHKPRRDKFRYFVAGREITHASQQRLLFFLMFWGKWYLEKTEVVEQDDHRRIVDGTFMPTEEARGGQLNSGAGCVMNAFLSTVLSRYWLQFTSTIDGEFATFLPSPDVWGDRLLEVTRDGELPLAVATFVSSLDLPRPDDTRPTSKPKIP